MARTSTRVLFIGNSFIARNDLPGLVVSLAATAGRPVAPTSITAGGASLRRHLNSGAIGPALAAGVDVIVLQEQSTLPVRNAARYHANVRDVLAEIGKAEAGAGAGAGAAFGSGSGSRRNRPLRIVLYETWARQSAPQSQAPLSAAVAAIGAEWDLEIAPAGQAWARVLADPDPPVLHDRDGSHPTLAGSFLAAAVIALAIFPADLDRIAVPDDNGLASADATRLLAAARDVMRAGVTKQGPRQLKETS